MSTSSSPIPRLSLTTEDTIKKQQQRDSFHQGHHHPSSGQLDPTLSNEKWILSNVSDIRNQTSPEPPSFASTSSGGTSGFFGAVTDVSRQASANTSPDRPPLGSAISFQNLSPNGYNNSVGSQKSLQNISPARHYIATSSNNPSPQQPSSQLEKRLVDLRNRRASFNALPGLGPSATSVAPAMNNSTLDSNNSNVLYQPPALADGLKRLAASNMSLSATPGGGNNVIPNPATASNVSLNYRTTGSLPIPTSSNNKSATILISNSNGPIRPPTANLAAPTMPTNIISSRSNLSVTEEKSEDSRLKNQTSSSSPPSKSRPRSASISVPGPLHTSPQQSATPQQRKSKSEPPKQQVHLSNIPASIPEYSESSSLKKETTGSFIDQEDFQKAMKRIRDLEQELESMKKKQSKQDQEIKTLGNQFDSLHSNSTHHSVGNNTVQQKDIQRLIQETVQHQFHAWISSPSSLISSADSQPLWAYLKDEAVKRIDAQLLSMRLSSRFHDIESELKRMEINLGKEIEMVKGMIHDQQKGFDKKMYDQQQQPAHEVRSRLQTLEGQLKHIVEYIQRPDSINLTSDFSFLNTDDMTADSDLSRNLENLDHLVHDIGQRASNVLAGAPATSTHKPVRPPIHSGNSQPQQQQRQSSPPRTNLQGRPVPVSRSTTPRPPTNSSVQPQQNADLPNLLKSMHQRLDGIMETMESDFRMELFHLRENQRDLSESIGKCMGSLELIKERQREMNDVNQVENHMTHQDNESTRQGRSRSAFGAHHFTSGSRIPSRSQSETRANVHSQSRRGFSDDSLDRLSKYQFSVTAPGPNRKKYTLEIGDIFEILDDRISIQLQHIQDSLAEKVDTRVLEGLVTHIATREELKRKITDVKQKIKTVSKVNTNTSVDHQEMRDVKKEIDKTVQERLASIWGVLNPLWEHWQSQIKSSTKENLNHHSTGQRDASPPSRHNQEAISRLHPRDQQLIRDWMSESVEDQFISLSQKLNLDFMALKRELIEVAGEKIESHSRTATAQKSTTTTTLSQMLHDIREKPSGPTSSHHAATQEVEQKLRTELKAWLRKHFLSKYVDKESLLSLQKEISENLKSEIRGSIKSSLESMKKAFNGNSDKFSHRQIDSPSMTRPKSIDSSDGTEQLISDLARVHDVSLSTMDHVKKTIMRDVDEKLFLICSDLSAVKTLYSKQVSQPFYKCGQWLWKSGTLKMGSAVPWNYQTVNTDEDNFRWEQDSVHIRIAEAGLYEICFAFFTKSKPSIQLVVNGESVLSAIHSPSYVVHHSSGFVLDGEGRLEPGSVSGISLIDFLALPTKSTLSVHHHGVKKGSLGHGFLSLRRL